ncbi:hypothetical protein C2G38_2035911 [Gigaspora rosea]|uniref:Uncharacterized protein n=1 Tax=Gigaspora rosea TaxID=44941 RepID=A0A397VE77_9GLOM|nr:hypothetical protein C2G38_2035911 [Gigaspora rosea]
MTLSELLENLDSTTLYYCGLRASDIGACLYKIRDDSVKPRNFLGTDNEDNIEAILLDHEGHSLHEFIDGNDPLRPIIDFNLPIETLNAITPKVSRKEACKAIQIAFRDVCLEIHLKCDKKSITVSTSSDAKKISLHISTTGMRLKNIAQVAAFTELVRKKL